MATVALGDWVKVTNHEEDDIIFRYSSKDYRVRAGMENMVPFEVVKHYYGDPRSQLQKYRLAIDENTTEWIEDRATQLQALSVMYGVYDPNNISGLDERDGEGNVNHRPGMRDIMKRVTVTTLDGEELVFPVDDPFCNKSLPAESDLSMAAAMARRVHDLENQLFTIKQQIEGSDNTVLQSELDNIPTDGGTKSELRVEIPEGSGGVQEDTPSLIRPPSVSRPKAKAGVTE